MLSLKKFLKEQLLTESSYFDEGSLLSLAFDCLITTNLKHAGKLRNPGTSLHGPERTLVISILDALEYCKHKAIRLPSLQNPDEVIENLKSALSLSDSHTIHHKAGEIEPELGSQDIGEDEY